MNKLVSAASFPALRWVREYRAEWLRPDLVAGLTLAAYQDALTRVRGTQLVHLEDMSGAEGDDDFLDRHVADERSNPLNQLGDRRMREALVDAIKLLPEREQYVMSMYYEHDMNLKEIAAVLGVTESRVCQLHSQSIARLRTRLREW